MEYILSIYLIFALDVVSASEVMPDLATCKEEATSIISEINLPSSVTIYVECAGEELGMEV